ncbi:MAG TPA: lactate racemase domain-containing protein [Bacteroidota bacterium]|nr:lactate racemase domain-containing protein [Bacteroidota bacterium]
MIGKGSPDRFLTEDEVRSVLSEAFAQQHFSGKRVLAIIPDGTRSAPIDIMFRQVTQLLTPQVRRLDYLIALGTHPPMSEEAIDQRLGLAPGERAARYSHVRVFNHHWKDARQLREIGTIGEDEVAALSGGLMRETVRVTVNTLVFDYDVVMIIGPTFPHEVVGFSGGNKYLFPGISGQEIIDMFHWLGAMITSPVIIGTRYTPVRKVVDAAAALLPMERYCVSLVVKGHDLAGLYCGTPEEAWAGAAGLSDKIHIVYKDRPYTRVLSCAPPMYDDLWVGAKCMYKLEPVVAPGGEVVIYAPHITEISVTHGKLIEEIGYHVRDYFVKQMDRFRHVPRGVIAHSTHVKGVGTFENGVEKPRITVTLATGIPESICRKVNLGYCDPRSIRPEEWQGREHEGVLYVPHAGEILYRLKDDPFASASSR